MLVVANVPPNFGVVMVVAAAAMDWMVVLAVVPVVRKRVYVNIAVDAEEVISGVKVMLLLLPNPD